jgi:hypothetical protein
LGREVTAAVNGADGSDITVDSRYAPNGDLSQKIETNVRHLEALLP